MVQKEEENLQTHFRAAGKVACVPFLVLKTGAPKLIKGDRNQRVVVAWWGEMRDGG